MKCLPQPKKRGEKEINSNTEKKKERKREREREREKERNKWWQIETHQTINTNWFRNSSPSLRRSVVQRTIHGSSTVCVVRLPRSIGRLDDDVSFSKRRKCEIHRQVTLSISSYTHSLSLSLSLFLSLSLSLSLIRPTHSSSWRTTKYTWLARGDVTGKRCAPDPSAP